MKIFERSLFQAAVCSFTLGVAIQAGAQSATVTLSSQKQYIRGYGGINHAAWVGDLTVAERNLAFGSASGQLGFSILRIPVTDGNPDSVNVATAKAALAAGAIVFASPWNAAKTYGSAQFASYATHLNDFVSYMKNQGVDLYAISVQNEPDYGAQSGWGSWTAAACHDFVLNYGATIATKLVSCESFNYAKSYYDPILNDAAALANVDIFGTHLYGTPVGSYAYPLFDSKGVGKERWMTEHYTDSTTDGNSWPNALGVATELHNAMVTGQFNAYVWWTIKRSYGPINNGAVTKRGYCMGQWSKFVRPGFYRVDATASPASGLALSAYKGPSSVVIVVVNANSAASSLSIAIAGSTASTFTKYTTSASKSLASDGTVNATNGSLSVTLDGSSVTSLVGSGVSSTGGGTGMGGGSGMGGATGKAGGSGNGGASGSGGASASGGTLASGGGGYQAGSGTSNPGGGAPVGGSASGGGPPATGGIFGTGGSQAGGKNPDGGGAGGGHASGRAGTGDGLSASDTGGCGVSPRSSHSSSLALLGLFGALAFGSRRRRINAVGAPYAGALRKR